MNYEVVKSIGTSWGGQMFLRKSESETNGLG